MTRRLVIVETTTEMQGIMTVARQSETEVRCDRCRHYIATHPNAPAVCRPTMMVGPPLGPDFGCALFEKKEE